MRLSLKKTMVLLFLLTASFSLSFSAIKKEYIWPKGKMPDRIWDFLTKKKLNL